MKRNALTNVQILRFVAAASVLMKHASFAFLSRDSWIHQLPWERGVDLFFVVSGFIMAWTTRDSPSGAASASAFLTRRIIRVVPPYWFFTTLMLGVLLVMPGMTNHPTVSISHVIASYAFVAWPSPDGSLFPVLLLGWTLNYEAFFYVCFAIALLFHKGQNWLIALFALLSAASYWIPESAPIARFYTSPGILEFVAGILLCRLYIAGWRWSYPPAVGCALLSIPLYLISLNLPPVLSWCGPLIVVIAATAITSAFVFAPQPETLGPLGRALNRGGDASYALYLSHPFTVNAVSQVWRAFALSYPVIGMLIGMALCIAVSIVFFMIVERPLTEALLRRLGKGPPRPSQLVAP